MAINITIFIKLVFPIEFESNKLNTRCIRTRYKLDILMVGEENVIGDVGVLIVLEKHEELFDGIYAIPCPLVHYTACLFDNQGLLAS